MKIGDLVTLSEVFHTTDFDAGTIEADNFKVSARKKIPFYTSKPPTDNNYRGLIGLVIGKVQEPTTAYTLNEAQDEEVESIWRVSWINGNHFNLTTQQSKLADIYLVVDCPSEDLRTF